MITSPIKLGTRTDREGIIHAYVMVAATDEILHEISTLSLDVAERDALAYDEWVSCISLIFKRMFEAITGIPTIMKAPEPVNRN